MKQNNLAPGNYVDFAYGEDAPKTPRRSFKVTRAKIKEALKGGWASAKAVAEWAEISEQLARAHIEAIGRQCVKDGWTERVFCRQKMRPRLYRLFECAVNVKPTGPQKVKR